MFDPPRLSGRQSSGLSGYGGILYEIGRAAVRLEK
ncbi:hypothetical protein M772_10830 [Neisseria gonorrhoeae MU_NG3]|nr:hypothetical protein M772_10830 [Neisseria gonorrhoeae MU_NG3]KLT09863.1 hypothetical protein M785_08710 [Neisseria gonorrhoeae MU_NG20]